MSKRLIIILALAFVVGIAFTAYAEVQNVKVSGDLTVYGINRMLDLRGNKDDRADKSMASIVRVKIDADLTDNVMATVRLLNERYWGREDTDNLTAGATNSDISLDLAYVTLKEFLYSPLTLTIGRQELHFGNDMIVGDYDTNNNVTTASAFGGATNRDKDLSARKAFDAIRLTLDYDPLVIDAIAAKVKERTLTISDDEDLYGINANYKLADMKYMKNTTVEGYWFEKRTGRRQSVATVVAKKVDRVDTVGGRIVTQPIENLTGSLEAAYQFGKNANIGTTATTNTETLERHAWALEAFLTYDFKKLKYTPSLTAAFAHFSGDHATGSTSNVDNTRAWDPMYENQKMGDIANALFGQTNANIVGGIVKSKTPLEDISVKGEYYAFWWDKAYPEGYTIPATARNTAADLVMTGRKFAGQEVDLTATYDYTEDVQFALMGGLFIPGSSFAKGNNSTATEVIGSMKVTF